MRESILLVEDKLAMRNMLTTALDEEGWKVTAVSSGSDALKLLSEEPYDLIISDVCLPGNCSGMDVLARARECCHWTPVVLMTAFGTVDMAVKAMKDGARDFITKPFELNEFLAMVRRYTLSPGTSLVGGSHSLMEAIARAKIGARTDMNVLVLGESGTGKELLSRMIHMESRFHEGPFVPVNCAAIPRELVESELFGAEKGAFTGADRSRPGRFELAKGGTIFLDEIADLDPALQGKLLRVLQEREYSRVGGTELKRTSARVIAASNRDIEAETSTGTFRKDLYFRLGEFPVVLPPLRDRLDDIPVLAGHFLHQSGCFGMTLSPGALARLSDYSWPGNVRELRSIVLRAAALCGGSTIEADLLEVGDTTRNSEGLLEESSRVARNREAELIRNALEKTGGNRKEAAALLKVSYRTLLSRLKELGQSGG
jgi:DNA-binding NtrC family response regulator